jgi:hypothetical protein
MAAAFLQEVIAKLRQLGSYVRLPLPAPAQQTKAAEAGGE